MDHQTAKAPESPTHATSRFPERPRTRLLACACLIAFLDVAILSGRDFGIERFIGVGSLVTAVVLLYLSAFVHELNRKTLAILGSVHARPSLVLKTAAWCALDILGFDTWIQWNIWHHLAEPSPPQWRSTVMILLSVPIALGFVALAWIALAGIVRMLLACLKRPWHFMASVAWYLALSEIAIVELGKSLSTMGGWSSDRVCSARGDLALNFAIVVQLLVLVPLIVFLVEPRRALTAWWVKCPSCGYPPSLGDERCCECGQWLRGIPAATPTLAP